MRLVVVVLVMLAVATLAGCKDMPGADGRYATHDHGGGNRGGDLRGLPVAPYNPP